MQHLFGKRMYLVAVMTCVKESPVPYRMAGFIQEEQKEYMNHDQQFFAEFLVVFFPEVHTEIDFESISPLSEALHTYLIKGENRRVDIVIGARFKGDDTLIVIHVEPQSYFQKRFLPAYVFLL